MSINYYDDSNTLFKMFLAHPVMSSYLEEFQIDNGNLKTVCEYLIQNSDELNDNTLNAFYTESDLLEELAELFGFDLPIDNKFSASGTKLSEFLNYTIYSFKFASQDGFYEENIFDFIPEYDREIIKDTPKLKIAIQALGKKLDQMEDAIARIPDIIDIDNAPDEVLNYLGQNIGYEKEDFSLSDTSFRELLKNIIEIYKIKGTNYSFSFFFKFLGFEIDLKEFFFNRDVMNPESFPGMTEDNVEFFLTTNNPILDTSEILGGTHVKPAKYLEQTKNLNDWDLELESIESAGCTNASQYLRGFESFNNDGITYHKNPWTYFKTNLMEYELNPFLDQVNLTASDNETIKKYVAFLSPTYLFTWININLRPWMEDINIIEDVDEDWSMSMVKVIGDPRPTPDPWPYDKKTASDPGFEPPYYDYEDMVNDTMLFKEGGDNLIFSITNNMDLDGVEILGTTLKRDGVHIRQPGHQRYLTDAKHRADKRIGFDSLTIMLDNGSGYKEYSDKPYPDLPTVPDPFDDKNINVGNTIDFKWDDVEGKSEYQLQVATNNQFNTDDADWITENMIYDRIDSQSSFQTPTDLHNDKYYWRVRVKNQLYQYEEESLRWGPWSDIWQFTLRSYPFPFDAEIIEKSTAFVNATYQWDQNLVNKNFTGATFSLLWTSTRQARGYQIEIEQNGDVTTFDVDTNEYEATWLNGTYNWRHRALMENEEWEEWSDFSEFTVSFSTII